jgi:DNA-binding NarL/FixJ family response regulator
LEVFVEQVRLTVCGLDHLTVLGLKSHLSSLPGFQVLPEHEQGSADVVVMALDNFSSDGIDLLRRTADEIGKPIVLIIDEVKEVELVVAVECEVVGILPRAASADERLPECIHATAAGDAHIPPNLLGQLLEHTERLHRELLAAHGLSRSGLAPREIAVLRLMADGLDTADIGTELNYSERTVKNIIHAITNRLNLRNRPQAVAYAMRAGVI